MLKSLVNKSPLVSLAAFCTVVFGLKTYVTMPREASPDVKVPVVMISTPYIGVAPRDIETLITVPIENELASLKDVKKMPRTPVMVVANHMSHYDIVTLALAVYPLRLSYMAKAELFNTWFLRNLLLRLGAFPVNRARPDRQALRGQSSHSRPCRRWGYSVFPAQLTLRRKQ